MNSLKKIASLSIALILLSPPLWCMEETTNLLKTDKPSIESYLNSSYAFMNHVEHGFNDDVKKYINGFLSSLYLKDAFDCNFECYKTLEIFPYSHQQALLSPDGKAVLISSKDEKAVLCSTETGKVVIIFEEPSRSIFSAAFSPNGKTVALGLARNKVHLYSTTTGKVEAEKELSATAIAAFIAFSPDGTTIFIVSCFDWKALLWNLITGEIKQLTDEFGIVLTDESGIMPLALSPLAAFSPDSKTLALGLLNKVCLYTTQTGAVKRQFEGLSSFCSIAFSPRDNTIVTGSNVGMVSLWNVKTGKEIDTIEGHSLDSFVKSVAFSPTGEAVVSGSTDTSVCVWNLESKEVKLFGRYSDSIKSVAFSLDGKTIIINSKDKKVVLCDATTGVEITKLEGHSNKVRSVALSSDGKIIITEVIDGTVCLWRKMPCDATKWMGTKAHPLQAEFINKAIQRKRLCGECSIFEGTLEYKIFKSMPLSVQEYLTKWCAVNIYSIIRTNDVWFIGLYSGESKR